jgi:hypothetical protein
MVLGPGDGLKLRCAHRQAPALALDPATHAQRVAVMPYSARRPPPAECHFYFAHRVSFLSCADTKAKRPTGDSAGRGRAAGSAAVRRQRLPRGDGPGALPRLGVVRDAWKQAAQRHDGREFAALLEGGTDSCGFRFGDVNITEAWGSGCRPASDVSGVSDIGAGTYRAQ